MPPSRGLVPQIRRLHTATHTFASLLTSALPTQIYLSTSTNPHLNLSLEHHLFTVLPPATRTLLLYTNAPSVILGRNQNPWVETNHPLLLGSRASVALLRRRSGGGTVFHDLGNSNYSITVPTATFHRDTHLHLVVRALHSLGVASAGVNARHDIVLQPSGRKVSGSAYKLARQRSYHHGTMLLHAALARVAALLRSPAAAAIAARGVASVPSPVANTGVAPAAFAAAVVREFAALYPGGVGVCEVSAEEAGRVGEVASGVEELRSEGWVYGQTPRFTMRLPGGVELVVDKGVVEGVSSGGGEGVVGGRFGGGVVARVLVRGGMAEAEAEAWAARMVGGNEWGS